MAGGINPIASLQGKVDSTGALVVAIEGGAGPSPDGVTVATNAADELATVRGVQSILLMPTTAQVLAGITALPAVAGYTYRVLTVRAVAVGGDAVSGTLDVFISGGAGLTARANGSALVESRASPIRRSLCSPLSRRLSVRVFGSRSNTC